MAPSAAKGSSAQITADDRRAVPAAVQAAQIAGARRSQGPVSATASRRGRIPQSQGLGAQAE